MADRKRKLEDEELNLEQSPSKRRKSYSIDMKLKIISEAKISNFSEISRKYKIDRACICRWTKNEDKLSEISSKNHVSKVTGKQERITKFRLFGGGRKV